MALTKIVDGVLSSGATITAGTKVGQIMVLINYGSAPVTLTGSSLLSLRENSAALETNESLQFFWTGYTWKAIVQPAPIDNDIVEAINFGLAESNTGSANRTAINSAVAAAVAANKPLIISAGTFNIDPPSSYSDGAIAISGTITIRGAGMDKTVLKLANYVSANGCIFIRVNAGLYKVVLEDLTLEGPTASSVALDTESLFGMYVFGGGEVTLRRVRTTMWVQSIKCSPEYPSYPGTGTKLILQDCYIQWRGVGVLHLEGTDPDADLFLPINTVFESDSATLLPPGGGSNSQMPATYINRGVSYVAINCRFLKTDSYGSAAGWGFQHYGGSATPRRAAAIGCYFGPSLEQGMLTSSTARTEVIGCEFVVGSGASAARPGGDCDFVGCRFLGLSGAQYGVLDDQGDLRLNFSDCHFGNYSGSAGFVYGVRRAAASSKDWRFNNCTFAGVDSTGFCIGIDATATVICQGCEFTDSVSNFTTYITKGKLILKDCIMSGSKKHAIDNTNGASVLELWRNRWLATAPVQIGSCATSIKINGADNEFYESSDSGEGLLITSTASLSNITGNLVPKRAVGTYAYASNVLTLGWNADTYSINEGGGPTINTINMKGTVSGGTAVASDHNRICAGLIRLHVKQAFTLGNAGNIIAAGGARTVDTIVTLQYIPSQGKWYEV